MEEYHKKCEPYYKAVDNYMTSFICPKCNDINTIDKEDIFLFSDRKKFTLIENSDTIGLWSCNTCETELVVGKYPEMDDFYVPTIKTFGDDDIFNKDYMKTIGFKVVEDNGECGKAVDLRTNGMTVLSWNRKGPGGTYFGDKFDKKAYYLVIEKDGGTRKAFYGYIFNREDMEKVLSLTW